MLALGEWLVQNRLPDGSVLIGQGDALDREKFETELSLQEMRSSVDLSGSSVSVHAIGGKREEGAIVAGSKQSSPLGVARRWTVGAPRAFNSSTLTEKPPHSRSAFSCAFGHCVKLRDGRWRGLLALGFHRNLG